MEHEVQTEVSKFLKNKASQQEIESFTCSILKILGEQTELYQKCYKDGYISNIGIGYQNSLIADLIVCPS